MPIRRLCARCLPALAALTLAWLGSAGATGAAPRPRSCLVPGLGKPLDRVWRPDMLAAIGYTDTRQGDVAFAVRTDERFYGYRPDHTEYDEPIRMRHANGRPAWSRRC